MSGALLNPTRMSLAEMLDAFKDYLITRGLFSPLTWPIVSAWFLKEFVDILEYLGIHVNAEASHATRINIDKQPKASGKGTGAHAEAKVIADATSGGTPATFGVDIKRLSTNADKLLASAVELDNVYDIIESITDDLDISGSSNALLKSNLKKINKSVKSCQRKVKRLGDAGIDCCDLYRNTERQLSRG